MIWENSGGIFSMKYKLIAMDLDGTLTNSQKEITDETRDVLIRLEELGVKLVLASGRPTPGLYKEAKTLRMDEFGGYILSFNGAAVHEYPSMRCIYSNTIDPHYIRPIINNAKALNLGILTYQGDNIIVDDPDTYKAKYEQKITCMGMKVVDDLREYVDFAPNKFLVSGPEEYLKSVYQDFKMPFGDRLSIYTSAPFYIEVVSNGINKSIGLEHVVKDCGISKDEIVAFGDEMNDLIMLQYAGYGVAMGNAVKPVKLIAKEVTASNDEDGIAKTLKKLFEDVL